MKKILLLFLLVITILFVGGGCSLNSEEKYIAVYGRDGTHISNIQLSKWNITRKVFDLDVSNFEGSCDDDITSGFIFVMNDKYGNKEYSGFMKSIVQDKKTGHVTFKGEDLRKIFDTEVLVDYTKNLDDSDYELDSMIMKIWLELSLDYNLAPFDIHLINSTDSTSTMDIAIFDGSYFYTNAFQFFKTYFAYHSKYLSAYYNEATHTVQFEIVDNLNSHNIRLDDFIFEKSTSELKVNHTVARYKFDTSEEDAIEWANTDKNAYDSASSKAFASGLASPYFYSDPNDLEEGFVLRLLVRDYDPNNRSPDYVYNYYIVSKTKNIWIPSTSSYYDSQPSDNKLLIEPIYDGSSSSEHTISIPNVKADDYDVNFAVKIDYPGTLISSKYFRSVQNYKQLPSSSAPVELKEIHYYLGLDNEVYKETIDQSLMVYPIVTKYFEDDFLSKAQFNAVWELVNSRYNENVIIDEVNSPVDIRKYNLFDMITIHDSNGDSKELPVSEIRWTNKSYTVKLGFKKERFTDIVKEATGTKTSGAITIKNPFKLIKDSSRLGNLSDNK